MNRGAFDFLTKPVDFGDRLEAGDPGAMPAFAALVGLRAGDVRAKSLSWDDFVCEGQKRCWYRAPERLGGTAIDHKLKLGGLLEWQVRRFRSVQNSGHVSCTSPLQRHPVRPV
jgi:hypothetical protein